MDATAAYNFIPLPDKILPADLDAYRKDLLSDDETRRHKAFRAFLNKKGNLSGHIDLDMETLTPLFIGGNGEQPFSPAGRVILPGSTIRGMVKNLLKIVSCGSWRGDEDVNDRHVYFRCLMATKKDPAWKGDLHKLYSNRMIGMRQGKVVRNAKTGFLARDKRGEYFVYPLLPQHAGRRILIGEYEDTFNVSVPVKGASVSWRDDTAYVITGSQPAYRLKRTRQAYEAVPESRRRTLGKQFIRYYSLRDADWSTNHRIPVPEAVISDYIEDTNRRGVDLLEDKGRLPAEKAKALGAGFDDDIISVIPCGYLERNGEVTAFGHGLCFRIPYENGIMDAIPANLQQDTIDFATAIFGNKERWASRVFFEDGEPEGNIEKLETATAHPLLQPNPTSYQLYLEQDGRKLKHWDAPEGVKIRGYKMYWHNKMSDWKATEDEAKLTNVVRKITPIKRGNHFHAKVRFQNLSELELGALLTVFDLAGESEKAAYKLGQGKSLGLGSVKMKATLHLDAADLYKTLFTDGSLAEQAPESDDSEYLKAFEAYIGKNGLSRCWAQTMRELAEMLDWHHADTTKGWSQRVKSMSGNVQTGDVDERFINRDILPGVDEVYNG
ncbi:TIGR03986 family CRISPR-associated RAMP protein [Mitsuokella jalaludinii]|uniref:TIGR03986 family type III CRISPR-associated RAMP protein n=1 Tax=Mitsuokella jalaludinii TaxID=187979 RepID=UPI002430FAA3|nr:TIGR03986 family CRISPR-associated RAMP protein [Mitsuokella jalaludinii]MCI7185954.1 TIGR03986 family CRISPR-associated RAMP protein [Mitsuokella jalaludinii]MCI7715758.1 TIGR03986 family CRISPR-associated RAMP protein [Mitsuokella jalaludinii]MDD7745461.1 TIGR03986 family CRISPR-associated RAMP protein [Mitsuokella jalaludinii]MDY5363882.1 TIGR03986 family CRISPR-associated RAMP protein [Mitsuokella jalaludinii]